MILTGCLERYREPLFPGQDGFVLSPAYSLSEFLLLVKSLYWKRVNWENWNHLWSAYRAQATWFLEGTQKVLNSRPYSVLRDLGNSIHFSVSPTLT